jgi:uncharacterized Ntn-hydrolase superfamily protein
MIRDRPIAPLSSGGCAISQIPSLSTFSIVAYDPAASEWGVAVQSKFLAVGAIVPWAKASAGAVATQARGNATFGPKGLAMMAEGVSAPEALERLIAADDERDHRQVGLIDAQGEAAIFTGEECLAWAGGLRGNHYAVQGNLLVSEATVEAMARAFEESSGELADRLVGALVTGQRAGGDRRGQQAAALLVVRENGGYGGDDRYVDLRVDDAVRPIERLQALLDLHHLTFQSPAAEDWAVIEGQLCRDLQRILRHVGQYEGPINGSYDEHTRQALSRLIGIENLTKRFREAENLIDEQVLLVLKRRLGLTDDHQEQPKGTLHKPRLVTR